MWFMDQDLRLYRKYLLGQARFYGILDTGYTNLRDLDRVASLMIDGGVQVIQLRAKQQSDKEITEIAERLRKLFFGVDALFIINDHPSIAREVGAHGVHVGQDDLPLAEVRLGLEPHQLIGKSTHSLAEAKAAALEGADYIGVGPIFATPTKPDYSPVGLKLISEVKGYVSVPQFCIGGINLENLHQVIAAGAERVVIVSGILKAADISGYCREVRNIMTIKGLVS